MRSPAPGWEPTLRCGLDREEDMARLSPFVNRHLGVHGAYSFVLPDLAPGAILVLPDSGTHRHTVDVAY
ncbi:hypothetical protein AB0B45_38250 [Nonomuraea sp. NPDC049152]|uniref:hypothetical protein n=1 Tax=Nonomuraea sp. NPDC049152 TaxID=3154350 RepID=UPI00340C3EBC